MVLLACAAACVAVSSQSLWIDEAQTALHAMPPTLHGWWQDLYAEHNSNMQLPLYMIYIWGWARLFGVSELALRAANIPWFFLGLFAIAHFLRSRPGLRGAAVLIYCVHPFVWYYLDEARPYLMQLSGAMMVAGCLFAGLDEDRFPASWWWLFAAGLTILCGAGLLGVPWAAAIAILLFLRPGFRQSMARAGLPALIVFIPCLLFLGLYLAWTIKDGARAGQQPMPLSSIPFVFYEHLGFIGLGPGRADMRSGGFGIFLSYLLPVCLLGVPLAYALARAAAVRFGLGPGRLLPVCLLVVIATGTVFALGIIKEFRVLGRHLTPLFPFLLCAVAFAISNLWAGRRLADRAVVCLIVTALAASALECRFAFRHAKDDNKDASSIAKAAIARGEDVWWVADLDSAVYYALPFSMSSEPGAALVLWNPAPSALSSQKPPAIILLCKPDLFDSAGAVSQYLALHHYHIDGTLPAFTVWRK